ncbi:hypothetical protein PVV23_25800, partial [Salmonella enterica subsp. enterica serovar Typhimurium]|uniref:hypothetical protein n=1 Tax=Salmonella enterica TaxID=28901 RepID=UPI002FF9277A
DRGHQPDELGQSFAGGGKLRVSRGAVDRDGRSLWRSGSDSRRPEDHTPRFKPPVASSRIHQPYETSTPAVLLGHSAHRAETHCASKLGCFGA